MNLYNGYVHEICVVIIHIYTWITVHHISYCEPPKTVCNRCSLSTGVVLRGVPTS